MGTKRYTPAIVSLLIECWEARTPYPEIAKICGLPIVAVYNWYYRNRYIRTDDAGPIRANGIPPHVGEEIIELRCNGLTFSEIAKVSGFDGKTIETYLHKRGFR